MRLFVVIVAGFCAFPSGAIGGEGLANAATVRLSGIDGSEARMMIEERQTHDAGSGLARICAVVPKDHKTRKGFHAASDMPVVVMPGQVSCVFVAPTKHKLTLYSDSGDGNLQRSIAVDVDLTGHEENVLFVEWITEAAK